MKRLLLAATVFILLSACGVRPGSARKSVEVEQPRQPAGPISQAHAEELYKESRFAEAVWIYEYLLEHGPVGNSSFSPQRAEFWRAKSRFQLGDHAGSLSLFLRIAATPDHEYHKLTLPWLASLARKLPSSPEPVAAMARYPVEILDDEAFDDVRDELHLLIGRWHVHHGDVALGRQLLAQVPRDSDHAILAQFELGELLWREGWIDDALTHHREVLALWSMQVAEYEALPRAGRRWRGPLVEPPELERSRQRLRSQGFVVAEPRERRR